MTQAKISVLIVTYKQADVIGRNIESILQQKEYGLHEIVICDDNSPDNNWEVISEYCQKYPNIIRAYKNEKNLGIYGNSMKVASLHGDADLFCWLEGDDALCDGFFKSTQEFISKNNVKLNEAVGIFADYYAINTMGQKVRMKNDFVLRNEPPFGAYMRSAATWRASLFSRKVIESFSPIELNKGLRLAEFLFDSQWFRFTDRTYYNPSVVGSIYYTGIGVSVTWGLTDNSSAYKTTESISRWLYLIDHDILTDKNDISWAKCQIEYCSCLDVFSFSKLMKFAFYFIKSNRNYQKLNMSSLFKRCARLILFKVRSRKK